MEETHPKHENVLDDLDEAVKNCQDFDEKYWEDQQSYNKHFLNMAKV